MSRVVPMCWSLTLLVLCLVKPASADDAKKVVPDDGANGETRKVVVARMKDILDQTKLVRLRPTPVAVELVPEPVLNWDDLPRGHFYGRLWVWGATGRPAAIVETYTINFAKDIGSWPGNVVHSLAPEALRAEGTLGWNWAPTEPGFTPKRLEKVPPPAATKTLRRSQMRTLARRFTANQNWMGSRTELRLLPTSIRMYESADDDSTDDGLLDGGLFAFVHGGTNPEVILILEAVHGETGDYWQYGCVRLGHAQMQAKFDDREAWSVETYDSVSPNSPYYWILPR
jgi:hypothetical protein